MSPFTDCHWGKMSEPHPITGPIRDHWQEKRILWAACDSDSEATACGGSHTLVAPNIHPLPGQSWSDHAEQG